uniref:C-type lectin domain-containing protein n=1 Tax=Sphaeramia orbicularis TaxID=375764 RepID=A0A672YE31_9TELE
MKNCISQQLLTWIDRISGLIGIKEFRSDSSREKTHVGTATKSFVFPGSCQCQAGWREYEDKCYLFSTDTKTWPLANAYCLEQNSNLMSIQDIHERVIFMACLMRG